MTDALHSLFEEADAALPELPAHAQQDEDVSFPLHVPQAVRIADAAAHGIHPIIVDARTRRDLVRSKTVTGLEKLFPLVGRTHELHVTDVRVKPADYSSNDQKTAILHGRTLAEPIVGTLTLRDKATGAIVDTKKSHVLAHLPYFTERHTFIVGGNEYEVPHQLRLKSGVYTRERDNGEYEAAFNLAKGHNFRLSMDPATGKMSAEFGTTTAPLKPLLNALGVSDAEIKHAWGAEVAGANAATKASSEAVVVNKLVSKVKRHKDTIANTPEARARYLADYFDGTRMDPSVTKRTLGHGYDRASPHAMLAASKKLLAVHQGRDEGDDRDSLEFKHIRSPDDFFQERMEKDAKRSVGAKVTWKMDKAKDKTIASIVPNSAFSRPLHSFLTSSAIAAVPTQYNPMEIIDHASKVTSLGEGGIQSDRAIPFEARKVHSTHLGVLDPVRTPESGHAGIDVRVSMGAHRDAHGNLYGRFLDPKGQAHIVPVSTIVQSVVGHANEHESGRKVVDALHREDNVRVGRGTVDYFVENPAHLFSPATALVPLLNGIQGNRAIMGGKFQTQALPLLEREAPYVISAGPRGNAMTEEIAKMTVPTSPVHGVVEKVDANYIYIRPHAEKHAFDVSRAMGRMERRQTGTETPEERAEYEAMGDRDLDAMYGGTSRMVTREDLAQYGMSDEDFAQHQRECAVLRAQWESEDLDDDDPAVAACPEAFGKHAAERCPVCGVGEYEMRERHREGNTICINGDTTKSSDWVQRATKQASDTSKLIRLPYDTNFPLAAKTYLHNTVTAKAGDTVKPGQQLADSNFTKDGHIALGKNLSVGYMAYYGKNSNDAVVISSGAAKKLTSEHMYKEVLRKGPDTIQSKDKYIAYYGTRYTQAQLDKLDANGVAKPDQHFEPGDPLILALEKAAPTPDAALLGHLHKSLVKPYRDASVVWEHHTPGRSVDVVNAARQAVVTMRTEEPMKVGDKLANRFGGKGVISEIVDDHRMVKDEAGKPIDVLFTSAGIVSRINPAQVVESALGKVVEKTGKPIVLPQFAEGDNVEFAKALLKKHGVKDKETVFDPVSGRHIPDVFVGRSYIHKLFKSTETNYAARGVSTYDVNLQPTKGGEEGAKGLGKMEINTLLAHNARNVLKDALTVKSEKSDDYWRALEFGLPPPPPKETFVSQKLGAMLTGAGIQLDKRGSTVALGALTDKHVKAMSAGALTLPTLEKSTSFMVTAKELKPEKGGLFDVTLTGGMNGTRWSHIELPEPSLNPIFEDPARRLLGMTKAQIRGAVAEKGGAALKRDLNAIDLDAKEKELLRTTQRARGADLDNAVKQLKYVRALKAQGHKAGDAYVVTHVPVIPPVMRPILPSQRAGELQIADANYLYRDLALAASGLEASKDTGLPELTHGARTHLYEAHAALAGIGDPVSPQLQGRGVKGFIATITGSGSPKSGFLFKKILKRQQDLTGRATATPDATLDLNQVGVPEDMLWTTYEKFIMKRLIGQGYNAVRAKEMIDQREPAARQALDLETKERPVFMNRAPSLHKHNMVAAYPVSVPGKTFRINPFMEKGMNLDFDGDTMQLHVPVSPGAVQEARQLTLSSLLFADKHADDLLIFPQHEAIIGTYLATKKPAAGDVKHFKTKADAIAAYKRGEITLQTPVEIG